MRNTKKVMLAVGLIAVAAGMTGCAADVRPAVTSSPQAAQQQTASPETVNPEETPGEAGSGTIEQQLALYVDEKDTKASALAEGEDLMLPLEATAKALGWDVKEEKTQEETQEKRMIALEKDESRITVSYTVSDNTIRQITWQKDGLLIPVDTRITAKDDIVYVPAAFFEEGMKASVSRTEKGVAVSSPKPMDTPQTNDPLYGENG